MSAKMPGVVKIVVKLPREEWIGLQRFRGGSDSDRICRILELANGNLTSAIKARRAAAEAEQAAEAEKTEATAAEAKPGLLQRIFGKASA